MQELKKNYTYSLVLSITLSNLAKPPQNCFSIAVQKLKVIVCLFLTQNRGIKLQDLKNTATETKQTRLINVAADSEQAMGGYFKNTCLEKSKLYVRYIYKQ